MGLFTPVWKNPKASEVKAVNAVFNIKDEAVLKDAAANASYRQARLAAIGRITDERFLSDYAKTASRNFDDERTAAIRAVHSPELLLDLACGHYENVFDDGGDYAIDAAKRITDAKFLTEALSSPYSAVRMFCLEKLNDQTLFKKAAVSDPDRRARLFALKHVTALKAKEDILFAMTDDTALCNALFDLVKADAAFGQEWWLKMYKKTHCASFPQSCAFIVGELEDENLLRDIALHAGVSDERCIAARKLNDEKVFAALVMDPDVAVSSRKDIYFDMKQRELVDSETRAMIEREDYRFWSEEDKRLADIMSRDSY